MKNELIVGRRLVLVAGNLVTG
uniref:Uncharacterized protein n=1 Tax=Nelumbo nucifera TaxID=4432 RepID=A0A822ZVL2_NELNU|nr:TPA_asm: hypothetical protein HUJ06_017257 [Nelumbo nucifera]